MEFKKLRFSEEDKKEMAALLKEYEHINLEKGEMAEIYVGESCGGVCKNSCSTWCEWKCDQACAETCTGTCIDFFRGGAGCFLR